jgi:hypothetical protein
VPAQRRQPPRQPASGQRDREQGQGRADRVGRRQRHGVGRDRLLGGEDRDGGQHGPGAGCPDQTERCADHESRNGAVATGQSAPGEGGQGLERPACDRPQTRQDERRARHGDGHQSGPPEGVLRQPERGQEARGEKGEDGEGGRQTDRHGDGRTTPPARADGQHHGQHRQDARRQERGRSGQQTDEDEHRPRVTPSRGASGLDLAARTPTPRQGTRSRGRRA